MREKIMGERERDKREREREREREHIAWEAQRRIEE
jgi:hypothetical protein